MGDMLDIVWAFSTFPAFWGWKAGAIIVRPPASRLQGII